MLQILSVIIIHSTPFDGLAQLSKVPVSELFQLSRIHFSGNRAIPSHHLEKLVRQYDHQLLTERDCFEIVRRIKLLYKTRGYSKVQVTTHIESDTFIFVIVEGNNV